MKQKLAKYQIWQETAMTKRRYVIRTVKRELVRLWHLDIENTLHLQPMMVLPRYILENSNGYQLVGTYREDLWRE